MKVENDLQEGVGKGIWRRIRVGAASWLALLGLVEPVVGQVVLLGQERLEAPERTRREKFGWSVQLLGNSAFVGTDDTSSFHLFQRTGPEVEGWVETLELPRIVDHTYNQGVSHVMAAEGDLLVTGNPDDREVYVFGRDVGGDDQWGEIVKLDPGEPLLSEFGRSVAISGERILVGTFQNVAYLFERTADGTDWGVTKRFELDGVGVHDRFGARVALSGDVAVLGVPRSNDAGSRAGEVRVFERGAGGDGAWGQVATLVGNTARNNRFGDAVAIDGNTIVVGASQYGSTRGAAYVFERSMSAPAWPIAKTLFGSGTNRFGISVDVEGDLVCVGDDYWGPGDFSTGRGIVYERNKGGAGSWGVASTLRAADWQTLGVRLGTSVSISGHRVLVGDPNNKQDEFIGGDVGAAYVFSFGGVAPSVVDRPDAVTVSAGEAFELEVEATGSPPLRYQWMRDDVELAGETAALLAVGVADAAAHGGSYRVVISNESGSVSSVPVAVDVSEEAPVITVYPEPVTTDSGRSFRLSADASGSLPMRYQWTYNGEAIEGATGKVLELGDLRMEQSGGYTVVVSNAFREARAEVPVVIRDRAPVVGVATGVVKASPGQAVFLEVETGGSEPLSVQWLRDGEVIAGATGERLEIGAAESVGAGGVYTAVVSNAFGTEVSPGQELRVERFAPDYVGFVRYAGERPSYQSVTLALDGDRAIVSVRQQWNEQLWVYEYDGSVWQEVAMLEKPELDTQITFGLEVALHGDTAVATASGAGRNGEAYIFQRNAGGEGNWGCVQTLEGLQGIGEGLFGSSVALDGDLLVVGDSRYRTENSFGGLMVYQLHDSGTWELVQVLLPRGRTDGLGNSVAIEGRRIVSGAPFAGSALRFSPGRVYVFESPEGEVNFEQVAVLKSPHEPDELVEGGEYDFNLGTWVSISGELVVVGTGWYFDEDETTTDGAFMFERRGDGEWGFKKRFDAEGGGDSKAAMFGRWGMIDGDTLVLAAQRDSQFGPSSGAFYVFRRDWGGPSAWGQAAKVTSPAARAGEQFGAPVLVDGGTILTSWWGGAVTGVHFYRSNSAPEIRADAPEETDEDSLLEIPVRVSDAEDVEGVEVRVADGPGWLSLEGGGGTYVLRGTPGNGDVGRHDVRLVAVDSGGERAEVGLSFEVREVNDRPVLVENPEVVVDEDGGPVVIELGDRFSDEEDETLAYVVELVGSGVLIEAVEMVGDDRLSVSLARDANGGAGVRVRATDSGGQSVEATLALRVRPVNDRPQVGVIPGVVAGESAAPVRLNLAEYFSDVDSGEGDVLRYTLVGQTNPEILGRVELGEATGFLDLVFAPYLSGESEVKVRATDVSGAFVEAVIAVELPVIPAPELGVSGVVRLNRQTGLYELVVTVDNHAPRAIGGLKVSLGRLPAGVRLIGGEAGGDGVVSLVYGSAIGAVESSVLTLELFAPQGLGGWSAAGLSGEVVRPVQPPLSEGEFVQIDRVVALAGGEMLVEFPTAVGRWFQVQYLDGAGGGWKDAGTRVRANANRTQWIDNGPPKTSAHPRDAGSRFYRVVGAR